MINLEKIKEEMIDKNEMFKIKKGSEVMMVMSPGYEMEGERFLYFNSYTNKNFHPSWLTGIHHCLDCECEDSYNFGYKTKEIQQFVVKESDGFGNFSVDMFKGFRRIHHCCNFGHKTKKYPHFVVKESDVIRVSGGV